MAGVLLVFLMMGMASGCAPSARHPDDAWWAADKAAHLAASAIIGVNTSFVVHQEGASASEAFGVGVILSLLAGVAKEVYDEHIRRTYWSWKDLFWDLVGAVTGSAVGANCCHEHASALDKKF